jgi:hypothetical protein
MNDLDHIADLCINYQPPYMQRLDKIADQIRILELEVELLNKRIDEKLAQQAANNPTASK